VTDAAFPDARRGSAFWADARAAGQPFVAAAECSGNRSSSRAGRPGRCGPRRRAGGLRSLVASASCVCPGGGSLGRAGSASSIAGGLWCSAPPRTRVAGPNRVSDSLPNRGSGLIIVSEPSAEAPRPVRTGQSAPACSRSSAVRSATPRYAGTRPIRVYTEAHNRSKISNHRPPAGLDSGMPQGWARR